VNSEPRYHCPIQFFQCSPALRSRAAHSEGTSFRLGPASVGVAAPSSAGTIDKM
jgi:hypothetical protein